MMKKLLLLTLFVLSLGTPVYGQERTHITTSGTLPANCSLGDVYVKTGASAGFYNCTATDTWVRTALISSIDTLTNKTISGTNNTLSDIAFSSLNTMAGLSVLGRSANSTGVTAAITGTDGQVLRVSGTSLTFGTVATAGIGDNQVTLAKLATQAADTILANLTAGAAVPTASTLTAILDDILGNTQGAIIFRNASAWVKLDPGANGTVLQSQGAGANLTWASAGAGDALTANPLSQFAATTSLQLSGVLTNETGTGAAVFGTGPTLSAPIFSTISNTGTLTLPTTTDTLVGRATTDTLTNKTIDAEGTGNTITVPSMVAFNAAICQGSTASLGFSTPASNPATAACVTGTNTQYAVAEFSDGATQSVQFHMPLPTDWTGVIDIAGKWRTSATTGSVVWQVQTVCVADAETGDPSFNSASTATDAAKGTTLQFNNFSITGVTTTGCAAGEEIYFRLFRDPTHGSDDIGAVAQLLSFTVTVRRAM